MLHAVMLKQELGVDLLLIMYLLSRNDTFTALQPPVDSIHHHWVIKWSFMGDQKPAAWT